MSSREAVEAFVSEHADRLVGFVHSAGILRDALLMNQDAEKYDAVFKPKAPRGVPFFFSPRRRRGRESYRLRGAGAAIARRRDRTSPRRVDTSTTRRPGRRCTSITPSRSLTATSWSSCGSFRPWPLTGIPASRRIVPPIVCWILSRATATPRACPARRCSGPVCFLRHIPFSTRPREVSSS